MAETSSGEKAREINSVGLVKSKSSGAFISIFTKGSILRFYGNLEVRVLGGVVYVESYAMKPCQDYVAVSAPVDRSSTAISMIPMDPDNPMKLGLNCEIGEKETADIEKPSRAALKDWNFQSDLLPFRGAQLLHFHVKKGGKLNPCGKLGEQVRRCIQLDLDRDDVKMLNSVVLVPPWQNVWAVALLRPLNNNLTEMLNQHGYGVHTDQQLLMASAHQAVQVTQPIVQAASHLQTYPGCSVVVCGVSGSGKSTLARYLINSLLNRHAVVGYLECDPGQCEFTCPEVLSLHLLTVPVFGPPYVHHRKPCKAYYFGDRSPRADPELYVRLLRSLLAMFRGEVQKSLPNVPLIVNTCGWLSDMGVQLFLDIVRSVSPTHIIRLLPSESSHIDSRKVLPSLTDALFTSTAGLFTAADRGHGTFVPAGKECDASTARPEGGHGTVVGVEPESQASVSAEKNEASEISLQATVGGDSSSDMEIFGSSEDAFDISGSSDEDSSSPFDKRPPVRAKHSTKRLKIANAKIKRRAQMAKRERLMASDQWRKVLSYQVLETFSPHSKTKNSSQQRKLSYMAYFSQLLPVAKLVSRDHKLSSPHQNLLLYVPPLAVPWRDIAIHVLHKVVPVDHLLYALNGKCVCLGQVDVEHVLPPESPDIFSSIKTSTPLITYRGLGLVRGIDPDNRKLYLTTPLRLDKETLQSVNVFVLGNPDSLSDIFQDHVAGEGISLYKAANFNPTPLGRHQWNPK